MADTGAHYAGTSADDGAVGTLTWADPSNAGGSGDSYATITSTVSAQSHYLKLTNFGFDADVGAGDTIDGIEVTVERKANLALTSRYVVDAVVRLVVGGTVSGDDKAATGTKWPLVEASASYGGNSDKWGLTPSAADVRGTDFGVALSASIATALGTEVVGYVDGVTVKVYYTAAGGQPRVARGYCVPGMRTWQPGRMP